MIKYNPFEPTDWATPLEKIYDRQSRQLDRYHEQLRERDRQEREAQIDWVGTIGKLADFSTTVAKAAKARKAKIQEKDWAEVNNVLNTAKSFEEVKAINTDYQLKKKGLLANWAEYEERIRASKTLTKEQKSATLIGTLRTLVPELNVCSLTNIPCANVFFVSDIIKLF